MSKEALTEAQERFLQRYEREGAGCEATEWVKRIRLSRNTYYHWRRKPEFLKHLEKIEEKNKEAVPDVRDLTFPEEGLERWMVAYLQDYQQNIDSWQARGVAKVDFTEVSNAKRNHKVFAQRLAEIEEEHRQRARDVLKQKGILQGTVSAIDKYLNAEDPNYARKITHDHNHKGGLLHVTASGREAAQDTWLSHFQAQLGPADLGDDDVLDADIMESP